MKNFINKNWSKVLVACVLFFNHYDLVIYAYNLFLIASFFGLATVFSLFKAGPALNTLTLKKDALSFLENNDDYFGFFMIVCALIVKQHYYTAILQATLIFTLAYLRDTYKKKDK